jgi:hypothetical protein
MALPIFRRLDREAMKEKTDVFRRVGMTSNENECLQRRGDLCHESPGNIPNFLTDSVVGEDEDHLRLCMKALKEAWSLGCITSSVAEVANSRLMRYCAAHNQSLAALRQIATQIEEQAEVNRRSVKSVKGRKSEDSQVSVFIRMLHVHRINK